MDSVCVFDDTPKLCCAFLLLPPYIMPWTCEFSFYVGWCWFKARM